MKTEPLRSLRFTWQSFGLWVGLTVVGFILGADLHLQTGGPTIPFNPRDLDLPVVGFLFGAVSGLIIGSLQWIVLKSWLPNARRWMLINVVGFGLVHALHDALPYRPLDLSLILIMDGIIVGLAQYLALRHSLSRAILWVPIAAVAWFLGFKLGLALITSFVQGNPIAEIVVGHGMAGLIMGALTGVTLKFLIIPVNLHPPAQSSRWTNMSTSKKLLLMGIFAVVAVILLIFTGMMLGIV